LTTTDGKANVGDGVMVGVGVIVGVVVSVGVSVSVAVGVSVGVEVGVSVGVGVLVHAAAVAVAALAVIVAICSADVPQATVKARQMIKGAVSFIALKLYVFAVNNQLYRSAILPLEVITFVSLPPFNKQMN
jgi:hypothetical protein